MNAAPEKNLPTIARFASGGSGIYATLLAVMAVVLILSNIGASKGVIIGPLVTDGGFFLFPLAYIVGDLVSEVYGFKKARLAITVSFLLSIFAAFCYWVIIWLPGAEWYDGQEALERTLGPIPLIVLASLAAFFVGQLFNAWVLVRMKQRTGERLLFGRIAVSTLAGEFVDTVVFCSIAAPVIGISNISTFANYVIVGFLFKSAVEIVLSPVTIAVIGAVKRAEPEYRANSAK
ncbi:queuosine precursor transporter [Canibacter zhoujuaniae]|uniref:queuosine precursor transporter n=1 Tax=Canibacter zhoujuaniae TaxID=2708343 RepID=UPI00142164CD|nr:queuosine precursor transporter [Canibacter zhoujuaniae]